MQNINIVVETQQTSEVLQFYLTEPQVISSAVGPVYNTLYSNISKTKKKLYP